MPLLLAGEKKGWREKKGLLQRGKEEKKCEGKKEKKHRFLFFFFSHLLSLSPLFHFFYGSFFFLYMSSSFSLSLVFAHPLLSLWEKRKKGPSKKKKEKERRKENNPPLPLFVVAKAYVLLFVCSFFRFSFFSLSLQTNRFFNCMTFVSLCVLLVQMGDGRGGGAQTRTKRGEKVGGGTKKNSLISLISLFLSLKNTKLKTRIAETASAPPRSIRGRKRASTGTTRLPQRLRGHR